MCLLLHDVTPKAKSLAARVQRAKTQSAQTQIFFLIPIAIAAAKAAAIAAKAAAIKGGIIAAKAAVFAKAAAAKAAAAKAAIAAKMAAAKATVKGVAGKFLGKVAGKVLGKKLSGMQLTLSNLCQERQLLLQRKFRPILCLKK